MMRYKVPRPRWWPGESEKSEPLTTPVSWTTWVVAAALVLASFLFLGIAFDRNSATPSIIHAWQGIRSVPPAGILFNGAVEGAFTGLTAVGLILIYRTTRIINFSQVALGSAAGIFVTQMVTGYDFPFLLVAPLGLLIAVVAGATAELLLRRFGKAPRLVVTVATIALAPLLTRIMGQLMSQLNPLPPGADPAAAALKTVPPPFPQFRFKLYPLQFGFGHVLTIVGSVAAMWALAYFLRRTRTGQAVRGAAENGEAAWLLGINIRLLSTLVWSLAALLAGMASIFSLTLNGIDTSGRDAGAAQMLPAIVAAMVAGMETMPLAMFFAIWFSVTEQGLKWAFPQLNFVELALLLAMLISLLVQRQRLQRREAKQGSAWEAAKDIRPTPRELLALPQIRNARYALMALGLIFLALFPWITSAGQTHGGGLVLIYTMITISLLILTGWAGQVSLGQFALVAVGAVFGGGLTAHWLWPFWIAVPVAALIGAGVAVLLGLPALRLKGLYLAAVTLGFALAVPVTLFNDQYFGWILPAGTINRPTLFFIDFNDERAFYYMLLACVIAVVYVAVKLRRSRSGRVLIALRDNEPAAQSVGINVLRTRVATFAVSGFIAAFAGAMLAHYEQSIQVAQFLPAASIEVFLMLVVGGLGSVSGAVIGAIVGAGALYLVPSLADLVTGSLAFMVMFVRPDGLAGVVYAVRDSILRVVALRLHIVVPSLFADYDAEAQKRHEMPLTQPVTGMGLATLPVTQRYSRESWLWNRRGEA
ncbi:MAG: ABC transporter permease [Candidatus Dormibacteria bacterium]